VKEARQKYNLDIWDFKLSQQDMEKLDALDRSTPDQNTMAGWLREHDPDFYWRICPGSLVATCKNISVEDPDPGSGIWYLVPFWPLDPDLGAGIGFFRILDHGYQTHIFESLVTNFWAKSSLILWKLAQIFSSEFQK
jgi:hypothetical protein